MFNFSFKFWGVPQKTITKEKLFSFINEKQEEVVIAKRINFATFHSHALYRSSNKKHIGTFKVPFKDTIDVIIKRKFGATLFDSQFDNKCYWNINSEEEYAKFEEFVNEYKDIVFLRDHLDLSLALSMNFDGDVHTPIGELEYQAKFNNNDEAVTELTGICKEWIEKFPFLKESDYICAMPSSNGATESLPHRIVKGLEGFEFMDISDSVSWTSKTRSVKDAATAEEKLEILEESGLQIAEGLDLKGKTVLLFDDLYMSGLSMQYVAMKLKEAGAAHVFGLCIVKSRSNTTKQDNERQ